MDTYDGTKIVDNGNKMVDDPENPVGCNTLTVGSFLVCKYGGIITPISSGQDREVKETEFIEGEAAYNRVMNFKCEEEIDRADGCDDLLHAMTKESADVHGSAFLMEEEGNGEEGSAEIGTKAEESSNKGEEEIDVGTISSNKGKYYNNIEKLVSQITEINADGRFTYDIKNFKDIYERNIDIYEEISQETGVPPALIAALHYRESGCNFTTYLHNGQPLGQKTTIVPKDVLYYDFTEAAIDAINSSQESKGIHLTQNSDIVMMMTFAELYNGTGYTKYHNMASPYVFSGTNVYEKGKYTGDGSFDSEVVDKQPGVYILVMSVLDEECNE